MLIESHGMQFSRQNINHLHHDIFDLGIALIGSKHTRFALVTIRAIALSSATIRLIAFCLATIQPITLCSAITPSEAQRTFTALWKIYLSLYSAETFGLARAPVYI